ncbi:CHRD domain-containing protein [Streptomyces sp. NPDC059009]|uniref:CHRD domain-containing protein n=1 Tax=Streptomyces sp. NPDC059009 TaxID=3346694 RepID=UPI0036B0036B
MGTFSTSTSTSTSSSTPTSRRRTLLVATAVVAAAAGVTAFVLPGDGEGDSARGGTHGAHSQSVEVQSGGAAVSRDGAGVSRGGALLVASMNGANEVPVQGGPAVGDKDGKALEFVQVKGDRVTVTVKWRGTGRPTMLHIHQGNKGVNGGIKVDFTKLLGAIKGNSVTGTVKVADAALLKQLKADPGGFYANLHTAEFPGGAVRGQLHKVSANIGFQGARASFQASVIQGQQIYECKKAAGGAATGSGSGAGSGSDSGKFAFAQRDVRARLGGDIAHSFVAPNSGTPQWIAPDRSAVTGQLVSKTPNGTENIPELDLRATQSGKRQGLLAGTAEILRLNTVGGVAPSGSCAKGAVVGVPYQADYVFVRR